MPDKFELLRRRLLDGSYSGDIAVDQRLRQAVDRGVETIRRMIRHGRELERMVDNSHTTADIQTLLERLDAIAAEEQRAHADLTNQGNAR